MKTEAEIKAYISKEIKYCQEARRSREEISDAHFWEFAGVEKGLVKLLRFIEGEK
jgi:hypothetical protein